MHAAGAAAESEGHEGTTVLILVVRDARLTSVLCPTIK
jgi:hypothetical protein